MSQFKERFLLGFTSPRNPMLIKEYIDVILKYDLDNKNYDNSFQREFYEVLSKEQVAGVESGNAKDKAFAGRDKLTRMPQALGFFITQKGKKFRVTPAGNLLKNAGLFEDVLLHQILKYQLPSPLHKESKSNMDRFCIKPFLEIIRLIDKVSYLTYNEFLSFGMFMTDYRKFDETVDNILKYRKKEMKLRKIKSH